MNNKVIQLFFSIIQHVILLLVAFIATIPIVSCVLTSFKTQDSIYNNSFFSFSKEMFTLENYKTIFNSGYFKALLLTLLIVLISVFISTLLNAMTAYVLCRFEFKTKRFVYMLILFASFIPSLTMQVYIFKMMATLNLVNNLFGYVFMVSGIDIVSITIFSRYFNSIPHSIEETALIEGCSYQKIFFKIHLPLLKQAFLTAAIIRTIYIYNEYYLANLYLLDKSKYSTVTTLLYSFSAPFGTQYNIICAGVILAAIPTILVFLIFQKKIYNGLMSTTKIQFE